MFQFHSLNRMRQNNASAQDPRSEIELRDSPLFSLSVSLCKILDPSFDFTKTDKGKINKFFITWKFTSERSSLNDLIVFFAKNKFKLDFLSIFSTLKKNRIRANANLFFFRESFLLCSSASTRRARRSPLGNSLADAWWGHEKFIMRDHF